MRFFGLIPARGNSRRFPRKNLRTLGGEPLVLRAARIASEAGLDKFQVATDDPIIADLVTSNGYNVLYESPELASDTTYTYQVLAYFTPKDYDYGICLQPDVPFRTSQDILNVMESARTYMPDMVLSYRWLGQYPVQVDHRGWLNPCPDYLYKRAELYRPAGVLECYSAQVLRDLDHMENYKRVLAYIPPNPWSYAVDIDEPEHLEIAEALLSYYNSKRDAVART